MKTLTMEVEIAIDGRLHLDIFSGLPPGQAEVVLVMQPVLPVHGQIELTKQTEHNDDERSSISGVVNGVYNVAQLSRQEKMDRIAELLSSALQGVEWSEIKEGRRDDANRY